MANLIYGSDSTNGLVSKRAEQGRRRTMMVTTMTTRNSNNKIVQNKVLESILCFALLWKEQ